MDTATSEVAIMPQDHLSSKTGGKIERVLLEEKVYRDTFPIVRLYQGFWMSALVFFFLMSFIPVFNWQSYHKTFALFGVGDTIMWILLLLTFLMLIGYIAIAMWIGVAVCRMRKWIGIIALLYCIPALLLSVFGSISAIWEATESVVSKQFPPFVLLVPAMMLFFVVPFGYFCFAGALAGRRFAFASDQTKRIVSELYTGTDSGWLSKLMGLPFPMAYMGKNKALSTFLFSLSGISFASFAVFAFFAFAFLMAPVMAIFSGELFGVSGLRPFGRTGNGYIDTQIDLMQYSPLIFAVLATLGLSIGKLARDKARQVSISSIIESHEFDKRKPILFLRPFYDDQVKLGVPRLSLLGRLVNLMQYKRSLDVLLLEEGTGFGPVVAVGNPADPVPRYGAARGYFTDGLWRDGVERLAKESSLIVICIDVVDGVMWELEHIAQKGHFEKTLFILHPANRERSKNKALRQLLINRIELAAPVHYDLAELVEADVPVLGFFFADKRLQVAHSTDFSEVSYLLTMRWFLRSGC